ncbi:hypothetical protein DFH07DRAFT_905932 [Mycena maculata]|uniref:Uncharacterized protein n=1 Tax=Mycena maculata TaxID=230809 RepID=A0AAD7I3X0_9AGAR|nr:hypothetical protein DFH07DRAFT_905932 [Mycena maculata]
MNAFWSSKLQGLSTKMTLCRSSTAMHAPSGLHRRQRLCHRSKGVQNNSQDAPLPDRKLDTGMGSVPYTQSEVEALSGTEGFMYIAWLGALTIPILDARRRVIAVLGGTPRDAADWKTVTDGAAAMLMERAERVRLSNDALHHRRAQEPFAPLARGLSHGGGQTELSEIFQSPPNMHLTDELLAHRYFQRLACFASILFAMWAPLIFMFYEEQMALLRWKKPSLRWCFPGSGWCAVTALGNFDPDLGGHLILWDLKLVIRFLPGSTILLPSALIRHSNVAIHAHEHRCSFTQYMAGGIFWWLCNGFKTDTVYRATASMEELAAREAEDEVRWKEGMGMYSVIDDL